MANENTPDAPQPGSQASPEPDPWVTLPRPRQAPPEGDAASPFARPVENPWGQPTAQEPTTPIPTTPYPVPEVQPWEQAPAPQPWEQAAQPRSTPPQPWEQAPAHPPQPWQGNPGQQQPWAAEPYQVGQHQQPPAGAGWAPQPGPSRTRDANPLSALFDFNFTTFATPGLVKIVYTLFVVAAIGTWVLWVLAAFVGASFGAGAASGLVVLLFGWIPALLSIAFTRFVLEGIVALIRIHDRVAEIAERQNDQPGA